MFRMIEKDAFFEGTFLAKDKEVAEFVETVRTRVQPVSCAYKLMAIVIV